jgi:hypothetical protein
MADAVGDFNRDGKLDLAIANFSLPSASVLLNACNMPPSLISTPVTCTAGRAFGELPDRQSQ